MPLKKLNKKIQQVLAKEVSTKEVLLLGIGSLVGGGVFTLLGPAIFLAGPAVIVALAINALVSFVLLILAIYLLKESFPDIRLIIVGEGPERKNFKFQILNLILLNNIEMIGKVPEEDKINLLAKSHIHVLPSVVEGFGLVTMEALSAGTPVVNADIPINKEILNGSQGGLLYKLGDYVDLSEKLEELLTNQKLYNRKVKEGFELVKKYDWDKVNKEYEHLLSN